MCRSVIHIGVALYLIIYGVASRICCRGNVLGVVCTVKAVKQRSKVGRACRDKLLRRAIVNKTCFRCGSGYVGSCLEYLEIKRSFAECVVAARLCRDCNGCYACVDVVGNRNGVVLILFKHGFAVLNRNVRRNRRACVGVCSRTLNRGGYCLCGNLRRNGNCCIAERIVSAIVCEGNRNSNITCSDICRRISADSGCYRNAVRSDKSADFKFTVVACACVCCTVIYL